MRRAIWFGIAVVIILCELVASIRFAPRWAFSVVLISVWGAILIFIWNDPGRLSRYYRMRGHCSACGYDLFGNTSGACPECGAPILEQTPDGKLK